MKKLSQWFVASSLALGCAAGIASEASAQARQVVSASGAQALSTPPAPMLSKYEERDDIKKRDPNPMHFAGVGVKVGMAGMGAGRLTITHGGESYSSRIEPRRGLHVAVPIDLGGDGFGWTFEPYLSMASVSVSSTGSTETRSASLNSYGLYTGPAVRFHVTQPLYVGLGLGLKSAYVHSNAFDLALDAYVRAPIHATYYVNNQVALVAELGFGYGASVYFNKPVPVVDPITRVVRNEEPDPQFGKAFAWDCTIGVRLP